VTAVQPLRPLADRGDAEAQTVSEQCTGQDVPQGYTAGDWYRKAVDQGDAEAQFNLGIPLDVVRRLSGGLYQPRKRDKDVDISGLDRRESRCTSWRHRGSPGDESPQSGLRASTVVAVVDPTLTLVNPATPVRRHPISIGSHTNEVRRLKPARRGFCGVTDMIQLRVTCPGFGKGRRAKRDRGNRRSDHGCAEHCAASHLIGCNPLELPNQRSTAHLTAFRLQATQQRNTSHQENPQPSLSVASRHTDRQSLASGMT
jgi:hypothetical protein